MRIRNTKSIPLILFLLFICFVLHAQEHDYIEYQKKITEAENALLDSNFSFSINKYKEVFNQYSFIFPKDAFIAAEVAAFTKSDSLALEFLKISIRYGMRIERIKDNKLFRHLVQSVHWKLFIKNEYSLLRQQYYCSIDMNYREKMDSLFICDQRIRNVSEKWYNNMIIVWRKGLARKWQLNCKNSLDLIMKFVNAKGFPSWKTIGVDGINCVNLYPTRITSSPALIILYHYNYPFSEYGKFLLDEVKKGNLNAREYALIRDFEARIYEVGQLWFRPKIKKTSYSNYEYYMRWFEQIPNMQIENEDEVNIARDAIGLSTLYYERKRKSFQNIHDYFYNDPNRLNFDLFYYDL